MTDVTIGQTREEYHPRATSFNLDRFRHAGPWQFRMTENRESLQAGNAGVLNLGLKVYIGTPEYDTLKGMLEAKATDEALEHYVCSLVLAKIDAKVLMNKVEYAIREAHNKGYEEAQRNIRDALGIRDE